MYYGQLLEVADPRPGRPELAKAKQHLKEGNL